MQMSSWVTDSQQVQGRPSGTWHPAVGSLQSSSKCVWRGCRELVKWSGLRDPRRSVGSHAREQGVILRFGVGSLGSLSTSRAMQEASALRPRWALTALGALFRAACLPGAACCRSPRRAGAATWTSSRGRGRCLQCGPAPRWWCASAEAPSCTCQRACWRPPLRQMESPFNSSNEKAGGPPLKPDRAAALETGCPGSEHSSQSGLGSVTWWAAWKEQPCAPSTQLLGSRHDYK